MKPSTRLIIRLVGLGLAAACFACHGQQDFSGSNELSKSEAKPGAAAAGGPAPQQHAPVAVVQRKPHP